MRTWYDSSTIDSLTGSTTVVLAVILPLVCDQSQAFDSMQCDATRSIPRGKGPKGGDAANHADCAPLIISEDYA